jgi:hypothetical protein
MPAAYQRQIIQQRSASHNSRSLAAPRNITRTRPDFKNSRASLSLNESNMAWRGDLHYRSRALGQAIDDLAQLPTALSKSERSHPQYLHGQRYAFAQAFDLTDIASSVRAA